MLFSSYFKKRLFVGQEKRRKKSKSKERKRVLEKSAVKRI